MSDRITNLTVLTLTAGIVGASIFVIVTMGLPLLDKQSAKPEPVAAMPTAPARRFEMPSEPAERTPVSPNLQREASQRLASGVYRCEDNGRIVYADQPCLNGRAVDPRALDGRPATTR